MQLHNMIELSNLLQALYPRHGHLSDGMLDLWHEALAHVEADLVTRGVDLNALVGKRFRVGETECRGIELCEPCTTFEARTAPGAIKALVHRTGLNAEILSGGELRPGDAVTAVD